MRDDKRQRILAAATTVFAERDFHRVLVSEVASRAGVGKGTVYLYFPTKDDLHRGALEASLERLGAEMQRAAVGEGPVDRVLRDIVLSVLRFFWRRPHLLTLALRYEQRNPRRAAERRRQVLGALGKLLARHRLGGNPSARHLSAAFLLGLARAAILEHAPEDRPDTAAARVVDVFLHGIGRRAGGGAVRRQRGAA
jgi:AcrR family transcriptional regulator